MRKNIFIALAAISIAFPVSVSASETRCGWYHNHDGSILSLTDSQGIWSINHLRSGFQSQGQNNLPSFEGKEHINRPWAGGSDVYACACLEVETDKSRQFITVIYGGEILPLSTCRNDPNLPSDPFRR